MPPLPRISPAELRRRLLRLGIIVDRQKGSHILLRHRDDATPPDFVVCMIRVAQKARYSHSTTCPIDVIQSNVDQEQLKNMNSGFRFTNNSTKRFIYRCSYCWVGYR